MKKQINWGMIGCGDVTEKKSAPSFNQIEGSALLALTNRTRRKADEYAARHNIPRVYDSAKELLADPEINAIYVATPPSSHAEYAILSMMSGKPVYVEKPMASTYAECLEMNEVAEKTGVPLFVAYYRRSMGYFLKVKELLEANSIGKPFLCRSSLFIPPRERGLAPENLPWRVLPEISGGGHFHDMGCHELDILSFLFGEVEEVSGFAENNGKLYKPEDTVTASIKFSNGLLYNGSWCFVSPEASACDEIVIIGEKGSLKFSCFGFTPIELSSVEGKKEYPVKSPDHVQLPMIRDVVKELQGIGRSPSKGNTAAQVNLWMEKILTN
jgi:1,5-anhydro-D-fructose reductase (1,5-anhydro-D-mannitol-forming)